MRLLIHGLLLILLMLVPLAPATAQDAPSPGISARSDRPPAIDPRQLLVPRKNPDGSLQAPPFLSDPVRWMAVKQQNFYGDLSRTLRAIKDEGRGRAGWLLFWISFAYGVFHAAGPGHGKTVISAWLFATENELKRGIMVAFLSAIIQALTAIVTVSVLLLFVKSASTAARDTAGFLESASYLMIAALGLYLLTTAFPRRHTPVGHDHGGTHAHAH
ncbi:MAG TPA: hypothetical protein PKE19_12495, partial [Aestuariivirga sp.]|nr:hypothetical protein [Aestuariivirga sp.]